MLVLNGMRTIMLSKIEDVENPKVGGIYLVPHVHSKIDWERWEKPKPEFEGFEYATHSKDWNHTPDFHRQYSPYEWFKECGEPIKYDGLHIPVIGKRHEDLKNLNFPFWHYHYDWRFIRKRHIWSLEIERFKALCNGEDFKKFGGYVFHVELLVSADITYLPRKMLRPAPMFPNDKKFLSINDFEKGYVGRNVLKGNICPHKGGPLNGAPTNEHGQRICPLHGLAFKAGKCVIRTN